MSIGCALAYRVGLTPWERAGEASAEHFTTLLAREEADRTAPWGRALDLGCGTGAHAVELAERGWQVTAVDTVPSALRQARERVRRHAVDVRLVEGDVTTMSPAEVGGDVGFFLDVGCFHGLRDAQRVAMGGRVTACASPSATLLLLALQPGRRGPLPRGASSADLAAAFPAWDLLDQQPADVSGMPKPLRGSAPQWYRLRRR